ncbi:hypothetical protein JHK82_043914 [Glycine max]|nr:hypothetical protein GLYMA_15G268300v4 [Glycine max]KAG4382032.1 hypothetical protein GLYMA_15G268300v4 [Glycine max]KAG4382033.1 hypothetical protein GLYMA_15G268300v4 [Glycine max]KAG4382035.1 hypothetical protein GLYMA_15G268300v4 [Glycine max]KAG4950558.1 hypothetical protein JHK86_043797 [Glycine max]|eukprot:XP_014622998.1 VQ motif-containing protein 17 isoform X1 [Glycine max]
MTKLHTCYPSSASSKLGIDKDSHVISKTKPKIRIIHVYAPEIIKTDAANFKELVQRLTGKPKEEEGRGKSKSKTALTKDPKDSHPKKVMVMQDDEFLSLQNRTRVKNEYKEEEIQDDMWRSKSNEKFSGFLDGFLELDGFMEELGIDNYLDSVAVHVY